MSRHTDSIFHFFEGSIMSWNTCLKRNHFILNKRLYVTTKAWGIALNKIFVDIQKEYFWTYKAVSFMCKRVRSVRPCITDECAASCALHCLQIQCCKMLFTKYNVITDPTAYNYRLVRLEFLLFEVIHIYSHLILSLYIIYLP